MDNIHKVLGPILLGVAINTYLFGLTGFQYAAYSDIPFNDHKHIKLPVFLLFLVDFYQSSTGMYIIWNYCVANYVNPASFELSFWAYTLIPISTGVCGLVAHIFLGFRIFKMTGLKAALVGSIVASVIVFALALACAVKGLASQLSMIQIISHDERLAPLILTWLSFQTFVDLSLSGGVLVVLARTPAFMSHLHPFNRSMRALVQSGFLTAAFSFAAVFSYYGGRNSNIYLVFSLSVGRLYSNLVLDTLLSRGQGKTTDTPTMTRDIWIPSGVRPTTSGNAITLSTIHVQTEIYSDATGRSKSRTDMMDGSDQLSSKFGPVDEV